MSRSAPSTLSIRAIRGPSDGAVIALAPCATRLGFVFFVCLLDVGVNRHRTGPDQTVVPSVVDCTPANRVRSGASGLGDGPEPLDTVVVCVFLCVLHR